MMAGRQITTSSGTPGSRYTPNMSAQYLTASALYNAGFRGWPLIIMTALAGREADWNPTALNNNPSTGDYSVGLWQINYYGDLLQGRTAEYGSPQLLLSNPQDQANAAYQLAGGNELVGLQNWALTPSPQAGVVPLGSTASVGQNTLAPFLAQATAAVSEVATFGPASADRIATASTWPGATPLGTALSTGASKSQQQQQLMQTLIGGQYSPNSCGNKGDVFNFLGFHFTHCNLKAVTGGAMMFFGGVVVIIGVASLAVGAFGGRGKGAAAIAPVIVVARAGGRGVRAVRTRGSRSEPTEAPVEEAS